MKRSKSLILFLMLASPLALSAQKPLDEKAAVIATIQMMFDGMRAGDSAMVRATFDTSARLQTTMVNKEGKPVIRTEEVSAFVAAVGTPHEVVWDERIQHYDVRIDGNLASVWTEYTFFLGEKMSHCGVNAFQLFKGEKGWKIIQITDTRRKTGCPEAAGSPVHKD